MVHQVRQQHGISVRLAYQPPTSSIFLSQQINHQQLVSNTFFLEQINTSNQQRTKRTGRISYSEQLCCRSNFRLHFHRFVNLAWLSMHEILWAAQTA
jgi:hypothetical protein